MGASAAWMARSFSGVVISERSQTARWRKPSGAPADTGRDRHATSSEPRVTIPPPADGVDAYDLDARRVRRHAARAAAGYDSAAWLPRRIAEALMEHLDPVRIRPRRVLDVGAGTGVCARLLERRYAGARVTCVDSAPAMLRVARGRGPRWLSRCAQACGDALHLPIADASIDLLVSSLMLPSCPSPQPVFAEFARVLKPEGLVMFASLGPDTLKELRASWAEVDARVHVHAFIDMHDLGDALVRVGLRDVVMDVERIDAEYADAAALMRELKQLGASNAARGCASGLTTRARMRALAAAYERRRNGAGLPATFEVVFGHAWRAAPARVEFPLRDLAPSRRPAPGA